MFAEFAELQRVNATFIASQGEAIEYRVGGKATWTPIVGHVYRAPVDVLGTLLANTIDIFVSREAIPEVRVGEDSIRIVADKPPPGEGPHVVYRVVDVVSRGDGHFQLRCLK